MFAETRASTTTLYLSNTTAVVANSSRAFSLEVVQDASFPGDNAHEIILYRVESKCSVLGTLTDNYTKVGSDLTSINVTTTYAWVGSSIKFHICGSANQSNLFQKRLDAVIVKGVNRLQFTETIPDNFYKGLYFFPGVNGEWMCTNEMVQIDDPDYYTVVFLPQSIGPGDHFNYSMLYNILSVDLSQLQDPITTTLHNDQDKWNVPGPPLFQTDICVIGTFKGRYNTSARSHIHIQTLYAIDVTPGVGVSILITASVLGLLGTILTISLYMYHCYKKKSVSFKINNH